MPDNVDLSIIIVTWNSESEIMNCLNSIKDNSGRLNIEIIVVDNNSHDGTRSLIKEYVSANNILTVLIENDRNLGFTKACNQGIKVSSGKNVLFLNPDTQIFENGIRKLYSRLESDPEAGAVAPQLLNPDKSIQYSCRTFPEYIDMFCELTLMSRIFPKSKTFSRWKMKYFDHNTERNVDQPMAAALMVKRRLLNDINNFDERFNMFFNDVDLCKSIYENGYKIIFFPESKFFHEKGKSIYKVRSEMIRIWNEDCLKYFKKHNYKFLKYNLLKIGLRVSGLFRR